MPDQSPIPSMKGESIMFLLCTLLSAGMSLQAIKNHNDRLFGPWVGAMVVVGILALVALMALAFTLDDLFFQIVEGQTFMRGRSRYSLGGRTRHE
jgi:hypothetical protein